MSMACALLLAAIAAIARPLHVAPPLHARPTRAAIATAGEPPRLPSGYRAVRIRMRWQAPERADGAR